MEFEVWNFMLPGMSPELFSALDGPPLLWVRVPVHPPLPAGRGRRHWRWCVRGVCVRWETWSPAEPWGNSSLIIGGRGDASAGRAGWCNALSPARCFPRGLSLAGQDRRDPGAEQVLRRPALWDRSLGEGLGERLQAPGTSLICSAWWPEIMAGHSLESPGVERAGAGWSMGIPPSLTPPPESTSHRPD